MNGRQKLAINFQLNQTCGDNYFIFESNITRFARNVSSLYVPLLVFYSLHKWENNKNRRYIVNMKAVVILVDRIWKHFSFFFCDRFQNAQNTGL